MSGPSGVILWKRSSATGVCSCDTASGPRRLLASSSSGYLEPSNVCAKVRLIHSPRIPCGKLGTRILSN
jgi:hypothetical protein